MIGFLGNPWFVGITTGLIAAGIIWLVSRAFLSKKDRREYRDKVANANRDVILAIRPGISEKQIPTPLVLEALINSTARRYGVLPTDLFNSTQIAEELIKEVMDTSFLSSAQKMEYCERLLPIRMTQPEVSEASKTTASSEGPNNERRLRIRMVEWVSMMLAISTGVITTFLAIPEFKLMGSELKSTRYELIFAPMGIVLATMALFSVLSTVKQTKIIKDKIDDASEKIRSVTKKLKEGAKAKSG